MTALLLPLLVAAATPAATAPAPAAPAPIDYARMIDEAIDGGRAIQAETMLGQWRAEAQPADAQPLAIATARLALAQGRDGDAEAAFAGMSQAGSTDCRVDEGLGIARLRLGRPQEALAPLQRAVAACAGRWRAWNGLGVAYDDAKSWTASAAAYERAFQLTDKPVLLLNNYGMSLMAQGRAEEAAAIFDKARDMAPDDAKIITNGDAAYVMSGRDIQRRPTDDADAWAKRLSDAGQVALRIGDVAKGQAYLSRAMTESERFLPEAAAALATIGPQKP
ncbi:MAG TPA: tetratricopeptide repeat protein [Sphingobium sp.]|nr:tetratricopeptide repeat protein [Sphingobium sp.]